MTAAEIAKKFNIRVYTIGLGTEQNNGYSDIDYTTLRRIANVTNGKFYSAQSQTELSQIYKDINKLEKTKLKIKGKSVKYEVYMPFAIAALICFLLEILLRLTVFKRIP